MAVELLLVLNSKSENNKAKHERASDLLEETQRKDEEMESLQDRVNVLETSTRVALDHLESVPEKLSLLEDFKDLRDSHSFSERIDGRYSKYRVSGECLQQRRGQVTVGKMQDDRPFGESSHAYGLDHSSSSWQDHSRFLSSPRFSHLNSFTKRTVTPDSSLIKEDAAGLPMEASLQSKKEDYESKNSKM
ncbi:hypothetical protein PAL_GLEAN10020715 [Pteropus alecto]|uniref:Centrosomal protein of 128 kDa n=1 Tax=Pteropus alecto TaxID=9402 RepID=L5JQ83_PTEAL|nr:hypothetical protein PAL_GLEAN10020715 [Pteropus alecto]